MKLGQTTKEVWSGDLVTECEFIANMDGGRMLFYDTHFHIFRSVFFEIYEGNVILNGWTCGKNINTLLKNEHREIENKH